jgi:hypothetical protein
MSSKLPSGVHFFSVQSASRFYLGYSGSLQSTPNFSRFQAIANGSFVSGASPVGALIVDSQIKSTGLALTGERGFVVTVKERIVIGRMNLSRVCATRAAPPDSAAQSLKDQVKRINGPAYVAYSENNVREAMQTLFNGFPTNLMSGAMLLRESAVNIDWNKDWYERQCFRQAGGNVVEEYSPDFVSGQFGSGATNHVLLGQTSGGNTTLVIAVQSTRADILSACSKFPTLLKLDGGRQFFAHAFINGKQYSNPGVHPLAIGVFK